LNAIDFILLANFLNIFNLCLFLFLDD